MRGASSSTRGDKPASQSGKTLKLDYLGGGWLPSWRLVPPLVLRFLQRDYERALCFCTTILMLKECRNFLR